MGNLVNIVHPYVWKVKGNAFHVGNVEEYKERDKKIVNFLRKSLDLGIKILRFDDTSRGDFQNILERGAFEEPPYEGIFYDERVIQVKAPSNAIPILDKKPKEISKENWEIVNKYCISHSDLKELIGNPKNTFYLGGYLEYCLINAVAYQKDHYTPDENVFVVEDLCSVYCLDEVTKAMSEFSSRNIKVIPYKEAMGML